jgi:enoyl-[acyl-carrier protein] reductase I
MPATVPLLAGRKALVFGVANDHSIAWAIAEAMHGAGAEVALSYAGPALEKRVRPLVESVGARLVLPCDVMRDEDVVAVFERVGQEWGGLDILVHAIAFAQREDLKGRFIDTGREGFRLALDVSVYSLIALTRAAVPLMTDRRAAVLTLTYLGSQRVLPHYNVMGVAKAALEATVRYLAHDLGPAGIRVNAISAGPIRTLSAAGISGFRDMLHHHAAVAPLRRNVTREEVAQTAVYLCSDMASAVTGEVVYADAGYGIMGT